VTVTRRKAMSIGTRLALSRGVSDGMALLRSRQAGLSIAMGPDATIPVILARLGKALSAVPVAAAPPMRAATIPATHAFEPDSSNTARSGVFNDAARRVVAPQVALMRVTRDNPAVSLTPSADGSRAMPLSAANRADGPSGDDRRATPNLTPAQGMGRGWGHQNGGPLSGKRSHEAGVTQLTSGDSHTPAAVPPSTDVSLRLSTTNLPSPTIAADGPSFAPVADPLTPKPAFGDTSQISRSMRTRSSAPVSPVSIAQVGRGAEPRWQFAAQSPRINARTLPNIPSAPINTPDPQSYATENGAILDPPPPSNPELNYRPQGTTTAALADNWSQATQADQEPGQGTIVLDGPELGRWVIGYLESQASRPGTMTTGIDPRMTATFPGAPTSA
jgi:hypothetical protein